VVNSLLKRYGCLDKATERWKKDNQEVDRWAKVPWAILMKYEDLVQETSNTIKHVLSFLQEPYDAKCLHPEMGKSGDTPRQSFAGVYTPENHKEFRNWQISQPVLDTREQWRSELSLEQIRVVNERLMPMLLEYGYRDVGNDESSFP